MTDDHLDDVLADLIRAHDDVALRLNVGASTLAEQVGTRAIRVAEALLAGEPDSAGAEFVRDVVGLVSAEVDLARAITAGKDVDGALRSFERTAGVEVDPGWRDRILGRDDGGATVAFRGHGPPADRFPPMPETGYPALGLRTCAHGRASFSGDCRIPPCPPDVA